jgi:hypothetical protein
MRSSRNTVARFVVVLACAASVACGKETLATESAATPPSGSAVLPPIDLVIGEPVLEPVPTAAPARTSADPVVVPAPEPEPEPEPATLPRAWTGPVIPGLTFADALHKARTSRDAASRLTATPPTPASAPPSVSTAAMTAAAAAKEASAKRWFVQTLTLADHASRMYAAAFHAPDATREGRIDAIAEAAELDVLVARAVSDAGLATLPSAWRADPAIASTFEDIAIGPARRLRDEARVLSRQCVDSARDDDVLTDAARRCSALRTGTTTKIAKAATDAGAPCPCSPGDPLCSSLGDWCAPR